MTFLIRPFVPVYLWWREQRGKEDPARRAERYGIAGKTRPVGRLYWLHAASVGESVSALVLARSLLKAEPEAHVLITSGTVTSAAMIEDRGQQISDRIIHQYVPLDVKSWGAAFLDHWQPDLAVLVEGDLWPGLIETAAQKNIPLAMASAQISEASLKFWTGHGKTHSKRVFPHFQKIFAVDKTHADRFAKLINHPDTVHIGGSLKMAAMPLDDIPEFSTNLEKAADGRPIILLASSHDGDEILFLDALEKLAPQHCFGVIAPRHPVRAGEITTLLKDRGLTCRMRSQSEWPKQTDQIWLADRMGEMGGLIRAADIIVLGGGFSPLGGHNPMEIAALGKGVISGSHVFKNTAAFALLAEREGVIFCDTSMTLARTLDLLLTSPTRRDQYNTGAHNAWKALATDADQIARQVLELVEDAGS